MQGTAAGAPRALGPLGVTWRLLWLLWSWTLVWLWIWTLARLGAGGDRHGRLPSLAESSQSFTEFLGLYGVDPVKLAGAGQPRCVTDVLGWRLGTPPLCAVTCVVMKGVASE